MAHSKRVLVVDDDAAITMMIQATLEDEGFDVAAAIGHEAIDLATQAPPDLILLDLMMPVMNGWEVRGRLLGDPRTADVPVVMMSSEGQLPAIARKLGAEACLPKPFDIEDLLQVVRQYAVAA